MAAPLPTARRKRHGTKKTALLWLLWLWALLAGTTLPVDGGRVRATSPVRFGRVEDVCRGEGVLFAPAVLYDADAGNARSLPFARAAVYAPDGETVAAGTPLFATPTGETVTAPVDGWFRTECDGWEPVWSGVDPAALDLSLYDETADEPPGKPPAANLVKGGAVYAAFVVEDAPDLRPGARCPLTLPDGTRHVCELLSLDTDGAR
ncbi:MAG: hypothetical protein J6125_03340, partial [Clostridia bacterium]|nr:hypothetical protein [Clostridia bacterium]